MLRFAQHDKHGMFDFIRRSAAKPVLANAGEVISASGTGNRFTSLAPVYWVVPPNDFVFAL